MSNCFLCQTRRITSKKFFSVPKNPLRKYNWDRACGVELPANCWICALHFPETAFIVGAQRTHLMTSAVPIFYIPPLWVLEPRLLKKTKSRRADISNLLNTEMEMITADAVEFITPDCNHYVSHLDGKGHTGDSMQNQCFTTNHEDVSKVLKTEIEVPMEDCDEFITRDCNQVVPIVGSDAHSGVNSLKAPQPHYSPNNEDISKLQDTEIQIKIEDNEEFITLDSNQHVPPPMVEDCHRGVNMLKQSQQSCDLNKEVISNLQDTEIQIKMEDDSAEFITTDCNQYIPTIVSDFHSGVTNKKQPQHSSPNSEDISNGPETEIKIKMEDAEDIIVSDANRVVSTINEEWPNDISTQNQPQQHCSQNSEAEIQIKMEDADDELIMIDSNQYGECHIAETVQNHQRQQLGSPNSYYTEDLTLMINAYLNRGPNRTDDITTTTLKHCNENFITTVVPNSLYDHAYASNYREPGYSVLLRQRAHHYEPNKCNKKTYTVKVLPIQQKGICRNVPRIGATKHQYYMPTYIAKDCHSTQQQRCCNSNNAISSTSTTEYSTPKLYDDDIERDRQTINDSVALSMTDCYEDATTPSRPKQRNDSCTYPPRDCQYENTAKQRFVEVLPSSQPQAQHQHGSTIAHIDPQTYTANDTRSVSTTQNQQHCSSNNSKTGVVIKRESTDDFIALDAITDCYQNATAPAATKQLNDTSSYAYRDCQSDNTAKRRSVEVLPSQAQEQPQHAYTIVHIDPETYTANDCRSDSTTQNQQHFPNNCFSKSDVVIKMENTDDSIALDNNENAALPIRPRHGNDPSSYPSYQIITDCYSNKYVVNLHTDALPSFTHNGIDAANKLQNKAKEDLCNNIEYVITEFDDPPASGIKANYIDKNSIYTVNSMTAAVTLTNEADRMLSGGFKAKNNKRNSRSKKNRNIFNKQKELSTFTQTIKSLNATDGLSSDKLLLLSHKFGKKYMPIIYTCILCKLNYHHKSLFTMHMKSKHSRNVMPSYTCPTCWQLFHYEQSLHTHLKSDHPLVILTFNCMLCELNFLSELDLAKHKARDHFQKRKYVCEVCAKRFDNEDLLNYHMRLHTPNCAGVK